MTQPLEPETFPRGNDASSTFFSGQVWLTQLLNPEQIDTMDIAIYNVTFASGCRNNWHIHTQGQVLLATRGVGYHQIKGQPIDIMCPGDVVICPPGVQHWHGASPDTEFSHIGISPNASTNQPIWLEPVTDADYHKREEN
jgi:quercetin dioxygenase-like cupin family protein